MLWLELWLLLSSQVVMLVVHDNRLISWHRRRPSRRCGEIASRPELGLRLGSILMRVGEIGMR